MLDFTQDPQPKPFGKRLFNFIVIVLLLLVAPSLLVAANQQSSIGMQVLLVGSMFSVYLGIGYVAYRLLKKATNQPVFHRPNVRDWRHLWYIVGMFFVMIGLEYGINLIRMALTGHIDTENQSAIEALVSHVNITMVAMMIYAIFLAPVVEEIVFRGLVINYFFRQSWWWANILLSGFLFAFPHMGTIPTNLSDLLSYLLYMSMGMVLAFVYKKSGHLQDNIAIHMLNNALSMIPLLLQVFWPMT